MKKIALGIIDDHTLFRQGISGLLNQQPGISVVLEASNGLDLLSRLSELNKKLPDVLLMDVQMPEMDGIEATKRVHAKYPGIKIIMLTMHDNDQMIFHLLENGASGFLAKNADLDVVISAITSVYEKGHYITDRVSAIMLKGVSGRKKKLSFNTTLTGRELEILKLICAEHTIKEIAEILGLSHRTVEAHKSRILEKVEARNTVGLVLFAMNNNLLDIRI